MKSHEIYKKETGEDKYYDSCELSQEYVEWLEKMVEDRYEPTILTWIKEMFAHAEKKQWFETYWSFDIHGTISKPDYRRDIKELNFYPYAKETLQLLSQRRDIIMIMFSSSYPEEIEIYMNEFENNNIKFDYINENPEVSTAKGSFGFYEKKHYFNIFLEDKSGFNPDRDWKFIYEFFLSQTYRPKPEWSTKIF